MVQEFTGRIVSVGITKRYKQKFIAQPHNFMVSDHVMDWITREGRPEGVVAEVELPEFGNLETISSAGAYRMLVLAGLRDPGNVGSLIRSALAFNWDAVALLKSTADPFSLTALRAAKGSTFKIPLLKYESWTSFQTALNLRKLKIVLSEIPSARKTCSNNDLVFSQPFSDISSEGLALVLGEESKGLLDIYETTKEHYCKIGIPISNAVDSLNVAMAGSILMHRLRRN